MTTKKPGSPDSVRHLRPDAMPPTPAYPQLSGELVEMETEPTDADLLAEDYAALAKLRRPFPPERIEKLPKPLWKGAWDTGSKGHCKDCGGYHVLANTIHLDYVGHANATDRLLEVDPLWDWEPLAYTADGLPLFDRSGGLWIKLTIRGVTRLGYGDGSGPKEIIGDAIRNAAMRFGLALDLWAKIDLHSERNPGDGPVRGGSTGGVSSARRDTPRNAGRANAAVAADPPRAANQDALASLGAVCDEHGYDRRAMRELYEGWTFKNTRPNTDLLDAADDDILAFAAHLIAEANPEPMDAGDGGVDEAGEGGVADLGDADAAGGDEGESVPAATDGDADEKADLF